MRTLKISMLLVVITLISLTSCTHDDTYMPIDTSVDDYNNSNFSKGGMMYDKFWSTEAGFDQSNSHLATINSSSNFFRCKQCHGWDGLGSNGAYISRAPKTSRPNVSSLKLYEIGKTKSPQELFDILKKTEGRRDISYDLSTYDPASNATEGDKMPDLNQLLTDEQIWDLVKFIREGMFDVSQLYDATYSGTYPTGTATFSNVGLDGNVPNGYAYFTNNCKACHGADGTNIELEGKTLGKFVRTKANEVQHKVKYGQPGSSPAMIGKFDITLEQMKDLYKYLADDLTFPSDFPVAGDMAKGGMMYDKFWSIESGFDQNNSNLATLNASSNFFRCKQCHGWDGLGSNGAYISRAPNTSRPNVSSLNLYELAQTKTAQELFDAMKETANRRDISYDLSAYDPASNATEGDKMPNLNQLLTDEEIGNIVKFLKEGMFDVSQLYDATYSGTYPTGTATFSNVGLDGNVPNGNAYYTNNCMACHGTNGTNIELEGKTLGKFVRTKANEVQHKVKYGQPGSSPAMIGKFDITMEQMKDLYKYAADDSIFPDDFPVTGDKAKGGIMYDKFWSNESGFDQNNANLATLNASSNFFRCKQCHGWDGLGNNGAYISRAPNTSRPNVSSLNLYELAQTKTAQELFDAMKKTEGRRDISYDLSTYDPATNATEGDKMPNLNQLLTDEEIGNLVNFLKEGMFDVSQLYDATYTGSYPTGSASFSNVGLDGNATEGNAYFTANCTSCHGSDGTTIELEAGMTVGKFVRSKANEAQHKIHYGQLGSSPAMIGKFDITLNEMRGLYKAIDNSTDFPDP